MALQPESFPDEALIEAHARIEQSEERWRSVFENSAIGVALADLNGRLIAANPVFQNMLAYTQEELERLTFIDITVEEDRELNRELVEELLAGKRKQFQIEKRYRTKSGSTVWARTSVSIVPGTERVPQFLMALSEDVTDRKRAEEELKANESRFRATIDTIPTMAWSCRPDGYCDFVNRRWLETTGLSGEEPLGWGWGVSIHPDDLKGLVEYWQAHLVSGETVDVEARMRLFDATYRWFLFRASPLRDKSGTILKWYGTNTDIDDRKRAEEALRASEFTLRETVDNIPGLVAKTNPTGGLEFLNQRTLEYFGKSIAEMETWAVDGTIHPDDVHGVIEARKKSIEEWKPYEYEVRCRRADGVYRWFQVRGGLPLRDAKGALTSRYLLLTDIEDRKRAEEELRRKEDFLATAQRLSLSGSFSWYLDTNEVVFSEEAYRIFEFDRHLPVTLEQIDNRIHPEDRHLLPEKRKDARTAGEGQDYQIRLLMPNGSVKYLHTTSTETRDTSGRRQYIGALQDVTQRWLAEEALNKARTELAHVSRVTALSALTASIAHEVNQPLSGIVTNAGTCLRMLDASPPNLEGARETARRTIRDGNRASEVITRLRALFSKTSTTFESFDLNETAEEVIALSLSELRRNGVILQLDLGAGIPSVFGDRIQIQQVILNLLRNASDAMSAVNDRPKELLVKTEREESPGAVRLSVKDAGVGITPEIEEELFDAFYTTKDDGMGIGLSVSRSIMESHKGRLWATRNDGPGSTFSFSMPCNSTDT